MKELLGKNHPQYGGIVTDIRNLPIGTTFHVNNGAWNGIIIDKNTIGVYTSTGLKRYKIDSRDPYFALNEIKIKYNNTNKKKIKEELIIPMPYENKQVAAKGGVDVILENNNYISINKDGSVIIKYSGIAYTFNNKEGFEKLFQSIDDQKVNCIDKMPFIQACLYGIAKPEDIDFYVEYWHTHDVDMTLRKFLGLSKKEYELLGKSDNSIIEEFLNKRRAMHAEDKKNI